MKCICFINSVDVEDPHLEGKINRYVTNAAKLLAGGFIHIEDVTYRCHLIGRRQHTWPWIFKAIQDSNMPDFQRALHDSLDPSRNFLHFLPDPTAPPPQKVVQKPTCSNNSSRFHELTASVSIVVIGKTFLVIVIALALCLLLHCDFSTQLLEL